MTSPKVYAEVYNLKARIVFIRHSVFIFIDLFEHQVRAAVTDHFLQAVGAPVADELPRYRCCMLSPPFIGFTISRRSQVPTVSRHSVSKGVLTILHAYYSRSTIESQPGVDRKCTLTMPGYLEPWN